MTAEDIGIWLRANGLPNDAALSPSADVPAGEIPPMPDKLVVLTLTGGGATLRERAFDQLALQVVTRDGQRSEQAAQVLTALVDDIFMGARPPISINGTYIASIDYAGGPPAFLDRDEAQRVLNVAAYTLQVARSVH